MSRKKLPAAGGGAARAAGIVVVAHGGSAVSRSPTSPIQVSVLRMIPVADAIRDAVRGSDDSVCNPADTWAYAERASAVVEVSAIEIRNGDHAMLRRARLWHAIAAEFARLSLAPPATGNGAPAAGSGPAAGPVADAFARAAVGQTRAVL